MTQVVKAIVLRLVQSLAKIGYLRQTVWMTLGGVAQRAVWVLLPVILSRLLSAEVLSAYLVMQNLLICLSVVTAVGMPTVLLRAVAADADPRNRWLLLLSARRLLLGVAIVLSMLCLAAGFWLESTGQRLPYGLSPGVWLAGLFATVTAGWLAAAQAYLQGMGLPRVVVQFQSGSALAMLVLIPVLAWWQGLPACLLVIGLVQSLEVFRLQQHVRQLLRGELRSVVAQSMLGGLGSKPSHGLGVSQRAKLRGTASAAVLSASKHDIARLAVPAWMSALLVAPAHVLIIGWIGHQLGDVRQSAALSVAIGWLAAVMMVPIFAGRSLLAALAAAPGESLSALLRHALVLVGALAALASVLVYVGLNLGPAWYGELTDAVIEQTTPVLIAGVLASWATVLGAALSAFGRETAGFFGNLVWLCMYVLGVSFLMGLQGIAVSWSLVGAYVVLVVVSVAQLWWVVRQDARRHGRTTVASGSEPA